MKKGSPSTWGNVLLKEIENFSSSSLIIWFLGAAGIAIKSPQALLLVDPYFGGSPDSDTLRMTAIPIDSTEIKCCDGVFSTHSHVDHCHRQTLLPILRNSGCKVIGAVSSIEMARSWGVSTDQLEPLPPGQRYLVHDLELESWPSNDASEPDAVSLVIYWKGVRLFHSGDSHPCTMFEEIGRTRPIDVAFLNFGGGTEHWYMDASEVLAMASMLRARTVVPIHWDVWKRTLPSLEDVARLRSSQEPIVHFLLMGDRLEHDRDLYWRVA